jgi:hypothetical protein
MPLDGERIAARSFGDPFELPAPDGHDAPAP